jgi:ABC-type multidrug transport system ATPase subunit
MLVKLILCAAVAAATIEWRGITAKIKDRDILRGVGGQAKAGRLHAIMGPSGSGKTSLLSALSGTCDRRLKLSGDLRADGVAVDKVEGAYVRQQDVFYPYLTVRETLTFAATLRLGADADVPKIVDDCVEINQCVGCTRQLFTKSFRGDDAAVLAR